MAYTRENVGASCNPFRRLFIEKYPSTDQSFCETVTFYYFHQSVVADQIIPLILVCLTFLIWSLTKVNDKTTSHSLYQIALTILGITIQVFGITSLLAFCYFCIKAVTIKHKNMATIVPQYKPKEFLDMDIFHKCAGYIPEISTLMTCDVVSLIILNLYRLFRLCKHIASTLQAQLLYPLTPFYHNEVIYGGIDEKYYFPVIMQFIFMVVIEDKFSSLPGRIPAKVRKVFHFIKDLALLFIGIYALGTFMSMYQGEIQVKQTSLCLETSHLPLRPFDARLLGIIRTNQSGLGQDILADYFCITLPFDIRYDKEFANFLPFWDSWEPLP